MAASLLPLLVCMPFVMVSPQLPIGTAHDEGKAQCTARQRPVVAVCGLSGPHFSLDGVLPFAGSVTVHWAVSHAPVCLSFAHVFVDPLPPAGPGATIFSGESTHCCPPLPCQCRPMVLLRGCSALDFLCRCAAGLGWRFLVDCTPESLSAVSKLRNKFGANPRNGIITMPHPAIVYTETCFERESGIFVASLLSHSLMSPLAYLQPSSSQAVTHPDPRAVSVLLEEAWRRLGRPHPPQTHSNWRRPCHHQLSRFQR